MQACIRGNRKIDDIGLAGVDDEVGDLPQRRPIPTNDLKLKRFSSDLWERLWQVAMLNHNV